MSFRCEPVGAAMGFEIDGIVLSLGAAQGFVYATETARGRTRFADGGEITLHDQTGTVIPITDAHRIRSADR